MIIQIGLINEASKKYRTLMAGYLTVIIKEQLRSSYEDSIKHFKVNTEIFLKLQDQLVTK